MKSFIRISEQIFDLFELVCSNERYGLLKMLSNQNLLLLLKSLIENILKFLQN